MRRVVAIGNEARDRIIKGANFVADAVKLTLGPAGQNFIIEKGLRVTNDGISVANEIRSQDELEDLGLRVLKEACVKTNDKAGDGTTTAITLAQSIMNTLVKLMPSQKNGIVIAGKMSPVAMVTKVRKETEEIIKLLEASAKPVATEKEMVDVAKVAVEYDDLANLIGVTQWQLGKDGTILAEETAEEKTSVELIKGIRIDNGFGTSLAINNKEKQSLELKDVHIVYTNHTLHTLTPFFKPNGIQKGVLQHLYDKGVRDVVVVARAWGEEAIKQCMMNQKDAGLNIYPINAPYTDQTEVMKDMQAVLGGRFVNSEAMELDDMTLSDVGFATKVVAYRYNAIFTGEGLGVPERMEELELEKKGDVSDFSKKLLDERMAQMNKGFALLKVHGVSERDRKHRFDKAVDGCNAVKSALQEGTVKGGGLALKEISEELPKDYLLKKAICAPYEQIQVNAGEELVVEDWVRDSLRSVRIGLEQASSVAAQLATTFGAASNEFPKSADEVLGRVLKTNEE